MGLDLPGPLETLLNDLGFTWPEVDEMQLFSLGSSWLSLGSAITGARQTAQNAADQVSSVNQGEAIDAFRKKWSGGNAPAAVLGDASTGVELGGAALMLCGGITLALKINTIVNLTILAFEIASAIAEAIPTFGASLAEIPVFKEITSRIINALVNEAINAIMS
jgi:hypothetical protein